MEKNKRKMGLGRGLEALLEGQSSSNEDVKNESPEQIGEVNEININNIEVNPYQPRNNFDSTSLNELKDSIQVQGIIQPITVRKINDTTYELISGERRLKASKLAGLTKIPAYVKEATDIQMLEMGLIENIQRENLNPVEVALAYQRLISECNLRHEDLGSRVGKDRSTVNNYLRLLNLPGIILDGLKEKKISMGHARALLGLSDEKIMTKIYQEAISKELSVRKVEELIKNINTEHKEAKKNNSSKKKYIVLEELQSVLDTVFNKKVSVISNENTKGEIKIPYTSKADLDILIKKLSKN